MIRTTAQTALLALMLGAGGAYADTSTTAQPAQNAPGTKVECPAPGTVAEANMPAECKNQGTSTTQAPAQNNTTTGTANSNTATGTNNNTTNNNAATGTQSGTSTSSDSVNTGSTQPPKAENTTGTTPPAADTTTQAAPVNSNDILASQFMGQTVYSTGNENVGEINDVVMNKELDNINAIIGVGGFLGIGEKDVAIPIDQITVTKDKDNKLHLTIAQTKEQLKAAPTFDKTALSR